MRFSKSVVSWVLAYQKFSRTLQTGVPRGQYVQRFEFENEEHFSSPAADARQVHHHGADPDIRRSGDGGATPL